MRTAGKRPKALRARRIRPQDSRFVPALMDRPPSARWPAPRNALPFALSASKQALCGDFQEPLSAAFRPRHLQKIFFTPSGRSLVRMLSSSHFLQERHAPPANVFPLLVWFRRTQALCIKPVSLLSFPIVKQRGAPYPPPTDKPPEEPRNFSVPPTGSALLQSQTRKSDPQQHQDR